LWSVIEMKSYPCSEYQAITDATDRAPSEFVVWQ
jgi:hypothetical protein